MEFGSLSLTELACRGSGWNTDSRCWLKGSLFMLGCTSIALIRHGQVSNPRQVYYGRLPGFSLSEEGQRQAQALAEVLRERPLAAVYSSPQLRARKTADIVIATHSKLKMRISQLLNESHTPFDGHPLSEVAARNWDVYSGVDSVYEQPSDILARTHRFLSQMRQEHTGQHVVAITHGDLIAFALLWLRGTTLRPQYKQTLCRFGLPENYPAPASVYTFAYETQSNDEKPVLQYMKPY